MEVSGEKISRRLFGKVLFCAGLCRAGTEKTGDPATKTDRSERQYRADAQILVFGATIYRRSGVGGGHALWAEGEMGRKLEFTGFSDPQRAAGLNRLGFIQEVSSSRTEFTYFGLMTSSPEETMDSARKALRSASEEVAFTAIDGRLRTGSADALVAQFHAPAAAFIHNREDLIRSARQALAAGVKRALEFDPRKTTAQPFLHALFEAFRRGANSTTYIYGNRLFDLTLRTASDEQATTAFRKSGLLPIGGNVVRVSGKIQPAAGGKPSEFRLWVDAGASPPIPLRIDYRPKSYLRLTFEVVPV